MNIKTLEMICIRHKKTLVFSTMTVDRQIYGNVHPGRSGLMPTQAQLPPPLTRRIRATLIDFA
jgi:hypothetical protein